ncbi:hypothetical protein K4L44_01870 [Halosquirtibacter laminarini]|uniref:Uncharacterized protein n=1 Tax=Halosquirtibacter laminarini TaxID=3374600 RepID=A0AC61NGA0_9BACT|nr:hypothetical protein K4L44_01870 [Prolixibacteraceae bacterium]
MNQNNLPVKIILKYYCGMKKEMFLLNDTLRIVGMKTKINGLGKRCFISFVKVEDILKLKTFLTRPL